MGFLVLARKPGENVVVELADGRTVRVVVVGTTRGVARLGFEAPPDVHIARGELFEPQNNETD